MLSNSGNTSSNANNQSLSSAMGEKAGSIGGVGNSSETTESQNPTHPSTGSNSKTSIKESNPQVGGESFGKALVGGIGELAMDKIAQTQQHIRQNTLGGKLATAIENPGALAQQRASMNPSKEPPDMKAEIAAFRDKTMKTG